MAPSLPHKANAERGNSKLKIIKLVNNDLAI